LIHWTAIYWTAVILYLFVVFIEMEDDTNASGVKIKNPRRKSVNEFIQSMLENNKGCRRWSILQDVALEPAPPLPSKSEQLERAENHNDKFQVARERAKSETAFQNFKMPTGYVSDELRPAMRSMQQELESKSAFEQTKKRSESASAEKRSDMFDICSSSKARRNSMSEFLNNRASLFFVRQSSRVNSNEITEYCSFNWEVLLALPGLIGTNGCNAADENVLVEVECRELPKEFVMPGLLLARWDDTKRDAIYQFQDEDGENQRKAIMKFMKWYGAEMRDLLFSNENVCIDVQPSITIRDLKRLIGKKLGVPFDKLCICAAEKVATRSDLEFFYKYLCLENSDILDESTMPKIKQKARLNVSFYNHAQVNLSLGSSCFVSTERLREEIESKFEILPPGNINLVLPEIVFGDNQTLQDCGVHMDRNFQSLDTEELYILHGSARMRKNQSKLRKDIIFTQAILGVLREGLPVQLYQSTGKESQIKTVSAVLRVSLDKKYNHFKKKLFVPKMTIEKSFCQKVFLRCDTFIARLFACSVGECKKDFSLLPSLVLIDQYSGNRIELQAFTLQQHECLKQALNTVTALFAECLGSNFL